MCLATATKRRVHSGAALVDGKIIKQCFPFAEFSIFSLILALYPFAKFAVLCLCVRKETTKMLDVCLQWLKTNSNDLLVCINWPCTILLCGAPVIVSVYTMQESLKGEAKIT